MDFLAGNGEENDLDWMNQSLNQTQDILTQSPQHQQQSSSSAPQTNNTSNQPLSTSTSSNNANNPNNINTTVYGTDHSELDYPDIDVE